jgi:hypothetical protein
MTEDQWNSCIKPEVMLGWLCEQGRFSDRKFRLFACACCRRLWDCLGDPCHRNLVTAIENHPDMNCEDPELKVALDATAVQEWTVGNEPIRWAVFHLRGIVNRTTKAANVLGLVSSVLLAAKNKPPAVENELWIYIDAIIAPYAAAEVEPRKLAALVRDVFGNPFQPVPALSPAVLAWNGATVRCLAQSMYDTRTFELMPVLADALGEAGCTDGAILEHCRGPGPHVRGCWLIDLIVGRW